MKSAGRAPPADRRPVNNQPVHAVTRVRSRCATKSAFKFIVQRGDNYHLETVNKTHANNILYICFTHHTTKAWIRHFISHSILLQIIIYYITPPTNSGAGAGAGAGAGLWHYIIFQTSPSFWIGVVVCKLHTDARFSI